MLPNSDDVPVLRGSADLPSSESDSVDISEYNVDRSGKCLSIFVRFDSVRGLLTPDAMLHIATLHSRIRIEY